MTVLDEFLSTTYEFFRNKNSTQLQNCFCVEPPYPASFGQLQRELQDGYHDSELLRQKINELVPTEDTFEDKPGASKAFVDFVQLFLEFWRDVDFRNLLKTHSLLQRVVKGLGIAFKEPRHGVLLLGTTRELCSKLTTLTMTLENNPDMTRQMRMMAEASQAKANADDTDTADISLAEATSTEVLVILRDSCLGIHSPPEKKQAIYFLANLTLKLVFQCRKPQSASKMFDNIEKSAPPLQGYPASQRVTYLFYLGRFHFGNYNFYFAQHCLQEAYDQCAVRFLKHRRLILKYLIASNMILGRFPSQQLLSRPEAVGLAEIFLPIARAIKSGDMIAFKHALGEDGGNEKWLFDNRLLLPLLSCCEVLVWRSLARKVFLLTYQNSNNPTDHHLTGTRTRAATLSIHYMLAAAQYCQKKLEGWIRPVNPIAALQPRIHTNAMFLKTPDLVPPPGGRKRLSASQGVTFGNRMPDDLEVEAVIASLVEQRLLRGYISHSAQMFAITGSKAHGGPLLAGFPNVWKVLLDRAKEEGRYNEVPGLAKEKKAGSLGGQVIRFSNLKGINQD